MSKTSVESREDLDAIFDGIEDRTKDKLLDLFWELREFPAWDELLTLSREIAKQNSPLRVQISEESDRVMTPVEALHYALTAHTPDVFLTLMKQVPPGEDPNKNIFLQFQRLMQYPPDVRRVIIDRRDIIKSKTEDVDFKLRLSRKLTLAWLIDQSIITMKEDLLGEAKREIDQSAGTIYCAPTEQMIRTLRRYTVYLESILYTVLSLLPIDLKIENRDEIIRAAIFILLGEDDLDDVWEVMGECISSKEDLAQINLVVYTLLGILRSLIDELEVFRKLNRKYGTKLVIQSNMSDTEIDLLVKKHRGLRKVAPLSYEVDFANLDPAMQTCLKNVENLIRIPGVLKSGV
ncbi:MAG: hypothetical protein ACUVXI_19715 [bacterium]